MGRIEWSHRVVRIECPRCTARGQSTESSNAAPHRVAIHHPPLAPNSPPTTHPSPPLAPQGVLAEPSAAGWTKRWLEVLKREATLGFHPEIPPFGFGDPTSYDIMAKAVHRLGMTGAVRHGAECFNFYFPQVRRGGEACG